MLVCHSDTITQMYSSLQTCIQTYTHLHFLEVIAHRYEVILTR